MDLGEVRKDFDKNPPLEISDLNKNPFNQFELWFKEAMESGFPEPNAFSLATVNKEGQPSQRTVLLKFFDEEGLVFYTNYQSRKAMEIAENSQVSALFAWYHLQRQIKIEGVAEKISRSQSLNYFLSRPKGSQLGAWASPQSKIIDSRDFLVLQLQSLKEKFKNGQIPLPDFWGGYRIKPKNFEFWQGQPSRLHDRFLYTKENNDWLIRRLAP